MTKYEVPTTSRLLTTLMILSVLVTVLIPEPSQARPSAVISRRKRVSDQRLAELETMLGLSKIKGIMITVPIAFGLVDPAKVGRKRRSADGENPDQSGELNLVLIPEESNAIIPLALNDQPEN